MLEALWSVEFVSSLQDFGAGVAVLETGRILGGDAGYYYVGSYKGENGVVQADITVTHYNGEPNSVFGPRKQFNLRLTGKPQEQVMGFHGYVVEDPDSRIAIRLTRRAELP